MTDEQEIVWAILLVCAKDEQNEVIFKKALYEAETKFGENSLQSGSVLSELARFYRDRGSTAEATDCEIRAESILRSFVADHPDIIERLKKEHQDGDGKENV